MTRNRIVATAPIGNAASRLFEPIAPLEVAPTPDEHTILGMLEGTIGLVCRGEARITSGIIDAGRALRVIGRPGAGYDSVDISAATRRGIPVIYAPVGGFAVAEGALALLLALIKQVPLCDTLVKTGQWQKRYDVEPGDMAEQTLGIVGLGRIGAHLAKLAGAFGMTILAHDDFADPATVAHLGVAMVSLGELLGRADYVSLHVPLTPETRGLINRERLAMMKRGAILINTSRGAVVESLDVLAEALESGQLGGVGLDVFPIEPPDASHRIFRDPRFLGAPHLLGVSALAMDRIVRSMAADMIAVLEHRTPRYCVNVEVLRARD